jgi:DNA-binding PadR family transcriptional regulator
MSHRKIILPGYKKISKHTINTLKHLVLNEESLQYRLDKIIGCSYRTILRVLHKLENDGLARIKRKEQSKRKGKMKNIWGPTFAGVLLVFNWLSNDPTQLHIISKIYRHEWIIFREWEYISESQTAKDYIIYEISQFFKRNALLLIYQLKHQPKLIIGKWTKNIVTEEVLGIQEALEDSPTAIKNLQHFILNPNLKPIIERYIQKSFKHMHNKLINYNKLKTELNITTS